MAGTAKTILHGAVNALVPAVNRAVVAAAKTRGYGPACTGVDKMKAFLEIELKGDDMRQMMKLWTGVTNMIFPGLGDLTFGGYPSSGWVAEITGFDKKFKYQRNFLRYKKDYSRANSKGSRYVYAEYILESGKLYDVKDNKERYFCTVNDEGDIITLTEQEVVEWLNNISELTYSQPQNNG